MIFETLLTDLLTVRQLKFDKRREFLSFAKKTILIDLKTLPMAILIWVLGSLFELIKYFDIIFAIR